MAQKVQVELIDDIDGTPAEETVRFALDGKSFEIDLSTDNAKSLREAMAEWVGAGRKVTSSANRSVRKAPSVPTNEVRAWANSNGMKVAERGRIPSQVVEAYLAATTAA